MKTPLSFFASALMLLGFTLMLTGLTTDDETDTRLTDPRDGKVYKTVTIGDQVWMAQNLAYRPERARGWSYRNNRRNLETYGYLYDWNTAQEVCPPGWRLPSFQDWEKLGESLGGVEAAGGKLKSTGTLKDRSGLWESPNLGATNESGFSGLPGGIRYSNGAFEHIGEFGFFWSSTPTPYDAEWSFGRTLIANRSDLHRNEVPKGAGMSVRCLQD